MPTHIQNSYLEYQPMLLHCPSISPPSTTLRLQELTTWVYCWINTLYQDIQSYNLNDRSLSLLYVYYRNIIFWCYSLFYIYIILSQVFMKNFILDLCHFILCEVATGNYYFCFKMCSIPTFFKLWHYISCFTSSCDTFYGKYSIIVNGRKGSNSFKRRDISI